MTTHLTDGEIADYRNRTVSAEQFLGMSEHLANCNECYGRCFPTDKIPQVFEFFRCNLNASLFSPTMHLTYEQIAGYVDGTLEDENDALCLDHLASCRECAEDIREIEALRDTRADPLPSQTRESIKATTPGFISSRIKRFFQSMQPATIRLLLGAAACAFVTIVGLSFAVLRTRTLAAQLQKTVGEMQAANASLSRQLIEADEAKATIASLQEKNETLTKLLSGRVDVLNDGSYRIAVDRQQGTVEGLDTLAQEYRDSVRSALLRGSVTMHTGPKLSFGQEGTLLGPKSKYSGFELSYPVATVVEETRPTFRWHPLKAATSYAVFIQDTETHEEVEGHPTAETRWISDKPLHRGHTYAWMVEAKVEGHLVRSPAPDQPFAGFKVLTEDQVDALRSARVKSHGSHLALGILYAKAGLRREAEREFQTVVDANPQSQLAKQLLSSVQSKR